MPRSHRTRADRLGIYRRDGRIVFGRAPYITEEQWQKIETQAQTPLRRALQWVGLTYGPDRTRVRRAYWRTDRTTD